MNLNELTGGGIPAEEDEVIVNPNLAKARQQNQPTGEVRSVDPIKLRGLKTKEELEQENARTEYDDIIENASKALKADQEKVEALIDTAEISGGNLDGEDMKNVFGIDPIAMMQNPPKLTEYDPKQETVTEETKTAPVEEDPIPTIHTANSPIDSIPAEEEDIESELDAPATNVADMRTAAAKHAANMAANTVDETRIPSAIPETSQDDLDAELAALDKELDEEEKSGSSMFTEDERTEYMKKDIQNKIKPIVNKFDISTFSVVKRSVVVNRTLEKAKEERTNNARVADWVLPSTKRRITVTGLLGTEISEFTSRSSRNDVEGVRDRFNMLYEHDITPGKPDSMEAWAKAISRNDYDHIFAAYYRACFENSNFIPYECDNERCQTSFISDNTPFMDIVKFKDSDTQKKFNDIMNDKYTGDPSLYVSEVTPISDIYAFSFKEPSLYDSFIKPAYVDREFINKYQEAFAISAFIDGIYYIDVDAKELKPVNIPEYPNNVAKSEKAKVMVIAKILRTLSSDQYSLLLSIMGSIGEDKGGISYITPETNCPRCGHKIEEQEISAANLLFLRHQLATLANG